MVKFKCGVRMGGSLCRIIFQQRLRIQYLFTILSLISVCFCPYSFCSPVFFASFSSHVYDGCRAIWHGAVSLVSAVHRMCLQKLDISRKHCERNKQGRSYLQTTRWVRNITSSGSLLLGTAPNEQGSLSQQCIRKRALLKGFGATWDTCFSISILRNAREGRPRCKRKTTKMLVSALIWYHFSFRWCSTCMEA